MPRKNILANILLYPISRLYGLGVYVRNKLFDWHVLKQHTFEVPVVVVGNISCGGTGKTPHVEYIVELLRKHYNVAVVSRGYKRKTKGFVEAATDSTPLDIGDEPYQIYHKFGGEVHVAVCEDRVRGIRELLDMHPDIDVVVLDDAFQHRYVKPTVAIVVTEFARPVYEDSLLPYGRLRESIDGLHRADMVIVSKCPKNTKAFDITVYSKNLDLFPYQESFFSNFEYGELKAVFPAYAAPTAPKLAWLTPNDWVLIVAGIGNPKPFVMYVKGFGCKARVNLFADHHNFRKKDIALIAERFRTMSGVEKYIITTEKDAVRIANSPYIPEDIKPYIYYVPINVNIMRGQDQEFEEKLLKLIRK